MQIEILMFDRNSLRTLYSCKTTLAVWAAERTNVIIPLAVTVLDRVT